jgi:hypothetical protein
MKRLHVHASAFNLDVPAVDALNTENEWDLEVRDGQRMLVVGRLLGFASSRRTDHTHGRTYDTGREYDRPARDAQASRCPACRWFEIRIFHVSGVDAEPTGEHQSGFPGPYLVHSLGPSVVLGERTFVRAEFARTGYEVIELCTVRRGDRGEPYLPAAAARALSQAAGVDRGIQDAYVNRAVA